MPPRLFVDIDLCAGAALALPAGAARHVQVLRLQPGDPLTLFDGRGGEWRANVVAMGRQTVSVQIDAAIAADRELALAVTLAIGMPANERMDALVEKATELGVARIRPLLCERSVLRLAGDRAEKKVAHWQAVATAAAEQSGRTRLPRIEPVAGLREWLRSLPDLGGDAAARWVLSLRDDALRFTGAVAEGEVVCLSGPEGGLSAAEEAAARDAGFVPIGLGPRTLRADTAPLAVLAHLALGSEPG